MHAVHVVACEVWPGIWSFVLLFAGVRGHFGGRFPDHDDEFGTVF